MTSYYLEYKILKGELTSFDDLKHFIQFMPKDYFESYLIQSYIVNSESNNLDFSSISDFYQSLDNLNLTYDSLSTDVKYVMNKHVLENLKSRLNETWSSDLWSIFKPASKSFDIDTLIYYLGSYNKVSNFFLN